MKYANHPVVLVGIGVVIGLVFAQQLKRVPGISKLPSV